MAALTGPRNVEQKTDLGADVIVPLAAASTIHLGGMVAADANGDAVPAADTAGLSVLGIAWRGYVGQPGQHQGGPMTPGEDPIGPTVNAGDYSVSVRRGCIKMDINGTVTQADIGKLCYVVDDHTVAASGTTNSIVAGRIMQVDSDGAWVNFFLQA